MRKNWIGNNKNEEEFGETDKEICKIGKKKKRSPGSEMHETIEEE